MRNNRPMSNAAERLSEQDVVDSTIRRNVKILAAVSSIRSTAIYGRLGISRQSYSSRLNGGTKFSAYELITLADIFDVTVEDIAGPTEALVGKVQNRKKLTTADLHLLDGGAKATKGTSVQGRLRLLTPVQ